MRTLTIIIFLIKFTFTHTIQAQKYEFDKELSCFDIDSNYFQYTSGSAKINIDIYDNIYILDKHSLIKLDKNKKFIDKWYSSDYTDNIEFKKQNLNNPFKDIFETNGIKSDSKGNIYLYGYGVINILDNNGKFLKTIVFNSNRIEDIAIDNYGYIYSLTMESIEKIDSNGISQTFFDPIFSNPENKNKIRYHSIEIDNKNNLYVLDIVNDNVYQFKSNGKFIKNITLNNHKKTKYYTSIDMTIDKNNLLYVLNGNNNILCFNDKGELKNEMKNDSISKTKIRFPSSFNIDSKGHIYIQSIFNGLAEFNSDYIFTKNWGTDGEPNFCLIEPNILYVNKDFIYVVDQQKILKYNLDGEFIEVFLKTRQLNGTIYRINDITEDEENNIVLLTQDNKYPLIFLNQKGEYIMKYTYINYDNFKSGYKIGISTKYYILENRSNYLKKTDHTGHVLNKIKSIDTTQSDSFITDFKIDYNGNIIVGFFNHSIQKFDKNGIFLNYIVKNDSTNSHNTYFLSLAIDDKGYVYTLNDDCEVLIFNNIGSLIDRFVLKDKGNPCLNYSESIAVSKDGGKIYITDKLNYRVQVFKKTYK